MGVDITRQFAGANEPHTGRVVSHSGGRAGYIPTVRAGCAIPNVRMRLLHFENAFGDAYASEYCLDAMLSLVLIVARSARPDADRLERLTGTADAAERTHASVRRTG